MRSRVLPLRWLVAVLAAAALLGSACSDDGGETTTGGTTASGGEIDFGSLSGQLAGSGATFPKAFYEEVITEFKAEAPKLQVTYGGGGSSKGKQDLADQLVVWAGSDSLVKDEDLAKFKGGPILYFPTVAAPITISYNLNSVEGLRLSPETIADIFERRITTWNDPAIAADNPDVDLPDQPITVARRADGSGTTTNFTKFLTRAAPNWTLGSGDTVNWPTDTQAGQGNGGVAQIVKDTSGAIGYVDLSDATAAGLQTAAVKNADGEYVEPTLEAASAALAGTEVADDLTYDPLFAPGAGAYPITAPTWVITYQRYSDATTVENLKGWLTFLLTSGEEIAPEVDFAPLPEELNRKAIAQIDQITAG